MSVKPEQPVLDAIDELVDWQLEDGRRRGEYQTRWIPVAELMAYREPVTPLDFDESLLAARLATLGNICAAAGLVLQPWQQEVMKALVRGGSSLSV